MIDVLIADDQVLLAQLLERVLGDAEGVRVVAVVGTAADACATARKLNPEVVLMDFRFPDGNGVQAATEILREVPDTKVVMLTAVEDDSIFLAAIQAGCSGFLTKHRALEDVEDAVRAVAGGEVLIAPDVLARVLRRVERDGADGTAELTPRELEVLALSAEGLTNPEIARRLVLSVKTVGNHVQNILAKLDSHSKLEAVTVAARRGLLTLGS